jgi:CubicO group peptidase (beta-lactamase class C family)
MSNINYSKQLQKDSTRSKFYKFSRTRIILLVTFILITFLLSKTAYVQDKTAEIDKIFSWITPTTPGCVCAVSEKGKLVFNKAYGSADLERNVALSTNSVLDAGSVVKQFVAVSILLLVEDGKLSLTEDVHKYIPELPDYGHKITLDHLLTHTSGIRDWTGIRPLADGDPDALTLTLRQQGLNFKPGDEWSYSNSGYVLLKEIVARISGISFSNFTKKRLFEPLNMSSTQYLFDMNDIVKNRALAYKKEKDQWKLDVLLGNDRGGGGALMSTASDLLIWNDALTNKSLGSFVSEKLIEPAVLNSGRKLGYARGLMLDEFSEGEKLIWHSGGAAGYSTLLVRLPQQNFSLAIMCNSDGSARSAYADRILDLYIPKKSTAGTNEKKTPADSGSASNNSNRAGLFFNEVNGQPLRLLVNNNILSIFRGGPLVAINSNKFRNKSNSLFFMSEADFELEFINEDKFELKTKDGSPLHFMRSKGWTPTAVELEAFSGLYESNEMGSVLEIKPEKTGLLMRFYRNPAKSLQFSPVDRDTFMFGMMTIRFMRNKEGKIVGYEYSNPVVRNIKFNKL